MKWGYCALVFVLAAGGAAAATVSVPANMKSGVAHDLVVPVRVSPASSVTEVQLSLEFDEVVMEATRVFRTGYTADFELSYDLGEPGLVHVTLEGASPLTGSGDVAWILFHMLGGQGASSTIGWIAASLNDGAIPVQTVGGTASVVSAMSSVGSPDGSTGTPGAQIVIPVFALPATGGDSFDLVVRFNPEVLDPLSAAKTPLTSAMSLFSNLDVPGEARLALYGTQPITGSGPIVNITYAIVGGLGAATALDTSRGDINEGGISSVLDDGLFVACTSQDLDGDSFSSCAGDCDEGNPSVSPSAVEQCNGLDDDCNGGIDTGIPVPGGTEQLVLSKVATSVELDWSATSLSTGYDVVRGELAALRASEGDFSASPVTCLGDEMAGTSLVDAGVAVDSWYLVRATNCTGAGTYDSISPPQQEPRDAELDAAPGACP